MNIEKRRAALLHVRQHYSLTPRWTFPPIDDTARLRFERLTADNAERCWQMFVGDTNPFLDEYFVKREEFEDYVDYLCNDMPYSPKRGGADWLCCLRAGDAQAEAVTDVADVGVLHLYDLSLENYADRLQRCTIGFASAAPFRRQGFMKEAVPHFAQYIAQALSRTRIVAYTKRENAASIALLQALNWTACDDDFSYPEYRYFRWTLPV